MSTEQNVLNKPEIIEPEIIKPALDMRQKINLMIKTLNKLRKKHARKYKLEYKKIKTIKYNREWSHNYNAKRRAIKEQCIYCGSIVEQPSKTRHLKQKICMRFQNLLNNIEK